MDEGIFRPAWEFYDRPGLLIGPIPYKRTPGGNWAPDYSHPGVAARIAAEVDFVVDQSWSMNKWRR